MQTNNFQRLATSCHLVRFFKLHQIYEFVVVVNVQPIQGLLVLLRIF